MFSGTLSEIALVITVALLVMGVFAVSAPVVRFRVKFPLYPTARSGTVHSTEPPDGGLHVQVAPEEGAAKET